MLGLLSGDVIMMVNWGTVVRALSPEFELFFFGVASPAAGSIMTIVMNRS